MPTKVCTKCKLKKSITNFNVCNKNKDKLQFRCKDCVNKAGTISKRLKKTGCSAEMYEELLVKQNECCAICGKLETAVRNGKPKQLCADHDHVTKEVRGLLCMKCNLGIGYLNDDVLLLESAISYLNKGN